MSGVPVAIRDEHAAHPIAGAWRPMLCAVVRRFVEGDYGLARGVPGVEPLDAQTADQIRACVSNYGATLIDLPPESWLSSVAQWYDPHWEVLVDLWTAEEGRSDLVLAGRVVETDAGPRLTVRLVYVP